MVTDLNVWTSEMFELNLWISSEVFFQVFTFESKLEESHGNLTQNETFFIANMKNISQAELGVQSFSFHGTIEKSCPFLMLKF